MKNRLRNKISNRRGETLVESLASIVIVTLSIALFMAVAVSTARVNARLKERIVQLGGEYSSAVRQLSPSAPGEITVTYAGTPSDYSVDIFGDGSLKSYRFAE